MTCTTTTEPAPTGALTRTWAHLEEVSRAMADAAGLLARSPSRGEQLRAAQTMHWCAVHLVDLDDHINHVARTSTEPAVLVLLHRIRVIRRVHALVQDRYAEALWEGRRLLTEGDPGESTRHGCMPYRVGVVHGGALGSSRRH